MQVAQKAPTQSTEQIVRDAAAKYNLNGDRLVEMASCESSLKADNVNYSYYENGYPSGLFQHISGYYPARALKYGYSTDVLNPYSNANVTAAMLADGLSYLWSCKY